MKRVEHFVTRGLDTNTWTNHDDVETMGRYFLSGVNVGMEDLDQELEPVTVGTTKTDFRNGQQSRVRFPITGIGILIWGGGR